LQELGVEVESANKILKKIVLLREEAEDDKIDVETEKKLISQGIKKLEHLRGLQNLNDDQKTDKAKNLVIKKNLLG
jgi:hypothetical protein